MNIVHICCTSIAVAPRARAAARHFCCTWSLVEWACTWTLNKNLNRTWIIFTYIFISFISFPAMLDRAHIAYIWKSDQIKPGQGRSMAQSMMVDGTWMVGGRRAVSMVRAVLALRAIVRVGVITAVAFIYTFLLLLLYAAIYLFCCCIYAAACYQHSFYKSQ